MIGGAPLPDDDHLREGEHLDWRISALLDGELGVTEEIVARAHLEECGRCQDEFVEITSARALVRELEDIEPPEGFIDRLIALDRWRISPRLGFAALLAAALAWIVLLVLGLGLAAPEVTPPVEELVVQHERVAGTLEVGDEADVPEGWSELGPDAIEDLAAPLVVPDALDGAGSLVAAFERDGVVHAVHAEDEIHTSVFQEEGTLDKGGLPPEGRSVDLGEGSGWLLAAEDGLLVLVVAQDGLVTTIVSDLPADRVLEVGEALPEPAPLSVGQRVGRIFENVARRLGLAHLPGW